MKNKKILLPILALVVANTLWGVNTVLIKMGVDSIPAPIFTTIRFLVASLILLPFALYTWKRLRPKDLMLLTLSSVFYISLSSLGLNIGLSMTTASNAAIIWLLSPLLLLVLSIIYLSEKLKFRTFIGILVALAGSLVIIGRPWESGDPHELAGNLLIVVSVFCAVIATLLAKPLAKKTSAYQMTFMSLFPGTVPVAIYSIFTLSDWDVSAVTTASSWALALSTVVVVISNYLFFYALRYKKAQDTGVYQYLDPLTTIIVAWFLLTERPSSTFALGAGLVLAGVYITEYHHRKLKRRTTQPRKASKTKRK